ncbi:hypothetical protein JCM24511_06301 [Saitozyma sp. JCM 24511]|nr:hypothetical protein JCM24511_06301 [Saitozyma sp. JCM 24511]
MSSAMSSALSRLAKAKRKWWRDTHPDQGEFSQESWDLQENVRLRNDQNKVWSVVLMHGRSYVSEGNIAAATIAGEADSVGGLWNLLAEKVIDPSFTDPESSIKVDTRFRVTRRDRPSSDIDEVATNAGRCIGRHQTSQQVRQLLVVDSMRGESEWEISNESDQVVTGPSMSADSEAYTPDPMWQRFPDRVKSTNTADITQRTLVIMLAPDRETRDAWLNERDKVFDNLPEDAWFQYLELN